MKVIPSRSLAILLVVLLSFLPLAILDVKAQEEDSWTSLAPLQQARGGLGVAVVDGKIYAIGGSTARGPYRPDTFAGGYVGTNEMYDPETNTWTSKTPMPTPRAHFAIVCASLSCPEITKEVYRGNKLDQQLSSHRHRSGRAPPPE